MRTVVARALRKEALRTAPPPRPQGEPQSATNWFRFTDADGNDWGDLRITRYRELKRATRMERSASAKRAKKQRKPGQGAGRPCLDVGRNKDGTRRVWREGEPLLVEKPLRQIARGVDFDVVNKIRTTYGFGPSSPKWWLDFIAQGGTLPPGITTDAQLLA